MQPREDIPIDAQLRDAEERLHMCEALDDAMSEPGVLWALMTTADDTEHALQLIREHFGFDDFQAYAVLDLQFRRANKGGRHLIAEQRRELGDLVSQLRVLAGLTSD